MKQNLIFIISSLDIGGTERHLLQILPRLAVAGWSVRVITTLHKGVLASALEQQGISVISAVHPKHLAWLQHLPLLLGRFIRMTLGIFGVYTQLKQEKNAISHCFLPEPYIIGMLAAGLARFKGPKIMSRRALNCYQQGRPFIKWLERKLHHQTAIITGNCAALVEQLHKEEQVPISQLRLIYNGIDTVNFKAVRSREEVRTLLGIVPDALVLIKVANLISYKGHANLLLALHQIRDQLPIDWRLLCVGRDDGIGESLAKQARDLELTEHILWMGMRQDIPDLLHSADMALLCSEQEGFSNAILESMAAALPMVVTDVGGNKEAVLDGETGYVVPARDPLALGRAILDLANQPEKAVAFGQRGQARVNEYFSLNSCIQAYEKLYESLS